MATRSKTPGASAKRGRTEPSQGGTAPAKPKAWRGRKPAMDQPEPMGGLAPHTPAKPAGRARAQEPSSDTLEQQSAAVKSGGDREREVLEAIRALGERAAEANNALAELREELREVNRRLEQFAAGRAAPAATSDADDYSFGRDRDPGDAVPPGVAATTPVPLTETDEAVLHTLEDLPKRAGRGRRGPRAKA